MRLHLGCGTNKLPGWVNVDSVAACRPDLVHDLTRPLPYPDCSVSEILAEDLLEHFDKYMRFVVFGEWARVLTIGGKVTLQVPNFKKILYRYFKFGYDKFVDFIFGENMWQSQVYLGHFGNHKWGYSTDTLAAFVRLFGIEPADIKTVELNIRLTGIKRGHKVLNDLKHQEIYAHANATGHGKATMTVEEAWGKIKEYQEGIKG